MNENKMSKEKRQYPRVKTRIPLLYRKRSDEAGAVGFGLLTNDVCAGGLQFRIKEFISKACRLILEIDLPVQTKPIQVSSKAAWINDVNTSVDYEIGNEFMEITKKDQAIISKYVNSHLADI